MFERLARALPQNLPWNAEQQRIVQDAYLDIHGMTQAMERYPQEWNRVRHYCAMDQSLGLESPLGKIAKMVFNASTLEPVVDLPQAII